MNDFISSVPKERRHALVLERSGSLLLQDGVQGHDDYVPCIAVRATMVPWGEVADPERDKEHVFIIDLRQALTLKRVIDKTIAHLEERGKEFKPC